MVSSCSAYGCTYRHKTGDNVGMYRFPRDPKLRDKWIKAVKRKNWKPTRYSRICGKHFQTGKPSFDENHPDYIPNVFVFSTSKNSATVYEKRLERLKERHSKSMRKYSDPGPSCEASGESSCPSSPDSEPMEEQNEEPMEQEQDEEEIEQQLLRNELIEKIKTMNKEILSLKAEKKELEVKLEQTELEMNSLRSEKFDLQEKISKLDPTTNILKDPKKLLLYTGINSPELFNHIIKMTSDGISTTSSLSLQTQLLMVLMKLKLNLLTSDIAVRFNTSRKTVFRTYDTWLPILAIRLSSFIRWPTPKALVKYRPEYLKDSEFKNLTCIIDCTEFPMQRPSNQIAQAQTFSNYKNRHTMKILVAVTPNAQFCFISQAWGGNVTDKQATLESGFMDNIKEGDVVLADRGFPLVEEFRSKGATLHVPSFKKGRKQIPKPEIIYSKKVSNIRIHVERAIRQLKRYHILNNPIHITLYPYLECIVKISAALNNMCDPIVT